MLVTKLDGRHTGRRKFEYYVEPQVNRFQLRDEWLDDFFAWRAWCWQVWGPGAELRYVTDRRYQLSPLWGWQTEFHNQRLYFKSETELSAFLFQWDVN